MRVPFDLKRRRCIRAYPAKGESSTAIFFQDGDSLLGEKTMHATTLIRIAMVTVILLASCTWSVIVTANEEAALLKSLESARLRSLVNADMEVAARLHAEEFQLITPSGGTYSKDRYLGDISTGVLDYLAWRPEEMTVRLYGETAAVRYRDSDFLVAVDGRPAWTGKLWHTNIYEKRGDNWVLVWSQASGGGPPEGE